MMRKMLALMLGVGMKITEAIVDCVSFSLLHWGLIMPSVESEPQSA